MNNRFLRILLFVNFAILIIAPLLSIFFSLFLIFTKSFNRRNINKIIVFMSLSIFSYGYLFNPNGFYIGDIVNYHLRFNMFSLENVLLINEVDNYLLKYYTNLFFYFFVYVFKHFSLSSQFLTAFLTSLIYSIFFFVLGTNFKRGNISKSILIYSLVYFLILYNPRLVFTSNINLLSFCFLLLAFMYHKNKILLYYLFLILAFTTHLSSLFVFVIFFISKQNLKSFYSWIIIIFFIFLSKYIFDFDFVKYFIASKSETYIHGRFSSFIGWKDNVLFIQNFFRFSFLLLIYLIQRKYCDTSKYRFFLYMLICFVPLIFFRSVGTRYISTGFIFFLPLIIDFFTNNKISITTKKKYILFLTIFPFLTHEWIYNFFSKSQLGDGLIYSIFMSWNQVLNFEIILP